MTDGSNRGGDHRTKKRDRFYLSSLARDHTEAALNLLVETVNDTTLKRSDRIKAAAELLERGWGKAPQEIKLGNIEGENEGVKFVVEVVTAGSPTTGSEGTSPGRSAELLVQEAGQVSEQSTPAGADQSVSGGNP